MEAGDDSLGLAPDGGPMKVMPFAFKVAGSLGFSLACPQPGHTASTYQGGQWVEIRKVQLRHYTK